MRKTTSLFGFITLIWMCGCSNPDAALNSAGGEGGDEAELEKELGYADPLQAAYQRYQARLNADGTLPENHWLTAKAQRDAMLAQQAGTDGPGDAIVWTALGPGNIGGRIRAIIVHPTDPNTLWIGATSGGIWKSVNGGAQWAPLDDFMASLAIGCMAIEPGDPNVLYAGTGEGFFETVEGTSNTAAIRGAGIFKTSNGGTTWTQLSATATPDFYFVNRLAIHPANPQTVLAATTTGIWRSADGGTSWAQTYAGYMYDLQYHPSDPNRAVAGGHEATPLYTTDGGLTWQAATGASGHRVELRYARSSPTNVFAAVSDDNQRIKVWQSTNGGVSYTLRTTGAGVSTYAAYNNVLWVDPTNLNNLMIGGVGLYRSTNAGQSLSSTFSVVHSDHHVIVEAPGFNGTTVRTAYFGNDGGIYRTTNIYSTNPVSLNTNLRITQFYGAAINANGVVVAGAQDNGTTRYNGNPDGWTPTLGGDGSFCAADPVDPNYLYYQTQYLSISRSSDGGVTETGIAGGIPEAGTLKTNFIAYILVDVNNADRMLGAAEQLWRTNNVKATPPTWTAIKPSIAPPVPAPLPGDPNGAHFAENSPYNISTMTIAEGDPNLIWVGHNNGQVWMTTNGTAVTPNWTRVDENGVGLPDRWISRIVIDRNNHNRVYVSVMGWATDNVWRTEDGGQTWTLIVGSGATQLPAAPVSALAQHHTQPMRLFVGTDIGIFTSTDDGATWTTSTQGPGTVSIEEFNWKDDNTLMAVTYGRGVFLGNVTSAPCNGDLNGDLRIDLADLAALLSNFGLTGGATYSQGDLNGDGNVDLTDLAAQLAQFGLVCG